MNPQPKKPMVSRALPYFQLVNVALNIAENLIEFYHHVNGQQVAGDHKLTSSEIATLNAGGTVVVTDKNGNTYHVKL